MEMLSRSNLSDQIFNLISNKIIHNELKQGEMIYETQISKEFGISRSPVRDALHMLEQIRLVDKTPKGNYQVTILTPELIQSLYDTAIVLYQYAFAKAAERASGKDLIQMEETLVEIEKSIEGEDFDLYLKNVTRMGKVILKAAANPIIERMALELMPTAERIQWASITTLPGQLKTIVSHIRRAYEYIATRKPQEASMAFNDFAAANINIVLSAIRDSLAQNMPEKINSAAG